MAARTTCVAFVNQRIVVGRTGTAAALLRTTSFSVMRIGGGGTASGVGSASNSNWGLPVGVGAAGVVLRGRRGSCDACGAGVDSVHDGLLTNHVSTYGLCDLAKQGPSASTRNCGRWGRRSA